MGRQATVVLLQETQEIEPREWIEAAQGVALLRQRKVDASGHLVRTPRQLDQLAADFRHRPPRVIFLAVGREQIGQALALLNGFKTLPPTTFVAVGGSYGTLLSYEFTSHPVVSAVMLGEWVESLPEFARAVLGEKTGEDIKGVWWKGTRGWQLTARRHYMPDLANWPDPSLEDFRAEDIARHWSSRLPILASRGFPFSTLFNAEPLLRNIQLSESFYHMRPPERVAQEATRLRAQFHVARFIFADDIFPWEDDWLRQFAGYWQRQVNLPFSITSAAGHLTRERLDLLVGARLAEVELKLESGCESLRNRLSDLNETNTAVRDAIALCTARGVATHLHVLFGTPGETHESLEESLAFLKNCGATRISAQVYKPWPESSHWTEVERSLTGETVPRIRMREHNEIAKDIVLAVAEAGKLHSLNRARLTKRRPDAALDALPDIGMGKLRSPYEGSVAVTMFSAPSGSHEVIALRAPSEVTWTTKLQNDPVLEFGILMEPALSGERSRLPVSFSVKVAQGGKTYRLFQKILVQSLDPDSRLWHWFKIPITNVKPGWADIIIENLIYGHDAAYVPPGRELWAGWARLSVGPKVHAQMLEETTDHQYTTEDFAGTRVSLIDHDS
ncbi:hypothetical protein BH09SUM1_BH09SUM1_07740 [soil metagenome]